MNEEKKYLLTEDDLHTIMLAASAKGDGLPDSMWLAKEIAAENVYQERTCYIEGYHEDGSGVSWLLSCDHDVDGYTKPCYCSECGARVVESR